MMTRSKLFFFSVSLFFAGFFNYAKAQSQVDILLNEYSASNIGGPNDAFGAPSDWVELRNAHTSSVSLASYYLSNDRNNLFKWKFPANFILQVGELKPVWLSGRNTQKNGEFHTNFTLEQCRNEWLILSTDQGVVRDSIFIQKTAGGHTRGRVDPANIGVGAWRLYTSHSFLLPNPLVNNYIDYCPTPRMVTSPPPTPSSDPKFNAGGFYISGTTPICYFKLDNTLAYDSAFSCFNIYYTTNGSYPVPGSPGTTLYPDSINGTSGLLTMALTTIVRAIAVPKPIPTCNQNYLPSFCETNTYFIDPDHNAFSSDFGVVSLAIEAPNWFQTSGAFSPTIHAEYYDKNKQVSEGYATISRPINESWLTKQRGMYISIDDRMGFGCGFEGNVFNVDLLGTSTRTNFPTLHLKSGDIESNSPLNPPAPNVTEGTGLRDVLFQSIAAKYNINVNPLHIKPVITFVNGKYYGVYDLREVYDKYYENYYHGQPLDSLTLAFYHNTDGTVSYQDGTSSNFNNDFDAKIYNEYITMGKPLKNAVNYNKLMQELDKESFIDYMVMNSYGMNSDLWNYNVAYARGGKSNFPGGKWHYYLWNAPTVFNYTAVQTNTFYFNNPNISPCSIYANATTNTVSPLRGNSHAVILNALMNPTTGNPDFQLAYKNRYQDLLNGPLKCENILKHFDAIQTLYSKEMKYHTDPATGLLFGTVIEPDSKCWDSNMVHLRKIIESRCYVVANYFNKPNCYGMVGPFEITVDVRPDSSAGKVKLNSELLPNYIWTGSYYSTKLTFQAVPSSTAFVFDHWEFVNPQNTKDPLTKDSVTYSFNSREEVVAVFTDKTRDISGSGENSNVPNGFTPNGDGLNDIFKPLGSANFTSEYEMTIWSRWGEEVFRSTSPQTGWDGTYKGGPAITGVYAYVIKYKTVDGENKIQKGNVTLTR